MTRPRSVLRARARPFGAVLAVALGAVLAALAFARRADAGEGSGFEIPSAAERGRAPAVLRGTYLHVASPTDAEGWGYVRFTVSNVDARPRTVSFSTAADLRGGARVERRLEPGAAATVVLPLLPSDGGMTVQVSVDGVGSWGAGAWSRTSYGRGRGWTAVAVDDRDLSKAGVQTTLTAGDAAARTSLGLSAAGRSASEVVRVEAEDLPDRWPLLSFADVIVVDGARPGLDAERQRVLVRAVAAGGALVVLSRSQLPAGPLTDLVATAAGTPGAAGASGVARKGTLGLGRWWAVEDALHVEAATGFSVSEGLASLFEEVAKELHRRPRSPDAVRGGALLSLFSGALEIPGVGRLPVRVFFFTILGFVLLAGPLSYVLLRRRKRLGAFLVLLPALGVVFSAAILLYGLLSEGTGIRGSVRSLSVLDQRSHEAVTRSGRTLYAAFSPGGLRLDPQTLLLSDDFERTPYGYRSRGGTQAFLDLDLTDGVRAAGNALPSRIPITYDVTTVAPARDRLRFRALAGGRFEARFAPDFAPVAGARTILLRDPAGGWHVGGRDGPLTPLDAKDVPRATRDLLGAVADLPRPEPEEAWDEYGSAYVRARRSGESPDPRIAAPDAHAAWFRGFLPGELPPGSYLALTERAPAFDDLGLDVAWTRAAHLVHGLLSAEDLGE